MQVQRVQVDMINVLVCKLLSSYQISLCLCELADAAAFPYVTNNLLK